MNTKDKKPKKPPDSKTKVYQKLHGGRRVLSIRARPEIIKSLKDFCRVNGVSICHIFEAMATGYLEGMKQKINWVNQSPTIELTVVREVKRIRRYKREYVGVGEAEDLYCALQDVYPPPDQLPSSACVTCPNVRCRDYVTKKIIE